MERVEKSQCLCINVVDTDRGRRSVVEEYDDQSPPMPSRGNRASKLLCRKLAVYQLHCSMCLDCRNTVQCVSGKFGVSVENEVCGGIRNMVDEEKHPGNVHRKYVRRHWGRGFWRMGGGLKEGNILATGLVEKRTISNSPRMSILKTRDSMSFLSHLSTAAARRIPSSLSSPDRDADESEAGSRNSWRKSSEKV